MSKKKIDKDDFVPFYTPDDIKEKEDLKRIDAYLKSAEKYREYLKKEIDSLKKKIDSNVKNNKEIDKETAEIHQKTIRKYIIDKETAEIHQKTISKYIVVLAATQELTNTDNLPKERIKNFQENLLATLNAGDKESILETRRDGPFMRFIREIGLIFGFNGKTKGLEFMENVGVDNSIRNSITAKKTLEELGLEQQPEAKFTSTGKEEQNSDSDRNDSTLGR